ncbi:MAG TPA: enolase C-terminal domain-like protein [Stellaceae bacterium]|nr:enolase C-terminal domain-like protein [Stellaceae bacterium]
MSVRSAVKIAEVKASAYTVPTDGPEADGTFRWDKTTIVLVEAAAGGKTGLGYTYGDASLAHLVNKTLAEQVVGEDALSVTGPLRKMYWRVRNLGRAGGSAMAISAVDAALWDLKAKLVDLPLAILLGPVREAVPVYGSGGFTTYSERQLRDQLDGWASQGMRWVKMKVGSDPAADAGRVHAARKAIGDKTELFVDANGAYTRKEALAFAIRFAQDGVTWFEEPVSSDDLDGLRLMRDRAPGGMEISAGEYGYDIFYFRNMLRAGAVDVLQADVTRCGGISGMMEVEALCRSQCLAMSSHCAPALTLAWGCAAPNVRHLEWFHDHVRIEAMFFDGAPQPKDGVIRPDLTRPGNGLALKREDAKRYAV